MYSLLRSLLSYFNSWNIVCHCISLFYKTCNFFELRGCSLAAAITWGVARYCCCGAGCGIHSAMLLWHGLWHSLCGCCDAAVARAAAFTLRMLRCRGRWRRLQTLCTFPVFSMPRQNLPDRRQTPDRPSRRTLLCRQRLPCRHRTFRFHPP